MSRAVVKQYADPAVIVDPARGVVFACGPTMPVDGSLGYAPGCIFLDNDAAAGSQFFLNEGTKASSDFNVLALPVASLSGLTATDTELNQAADNSVNTEVVTATNVITAAESGATFFLSSVTEFVSTLPAPFLGARFKFIVAAAPSGASYTVVTTGAATIIVGEVLTSQDAGGSADSGTAGEATITFVDSKAVKGDWCEVISDGTNWYMTAGCKVFDGITLS